jgi:hypothetical protein
MWHLFFFIFFGYERLVLLSFWTNFGIRLCSALGSIFLCSLPHFHCMWCPCAPLLLDTCLGHESIVLLSFWTNFGIRLHSVPFFYVLSLVFTVCDTCVSLFFLIHLQYKRLVLSLFWTSSFLLAAQYCCVLGNHSLYYCSGSSIGNSENLVWFSG